MKLIATLTILLFQNAVWSQIVGAFNADNGPAQGFVSTLIQDKSGYIWAGTNNGLSRFDGTRFKNYRAVSNSTTALYSNKINQLLKDQSGRLWVVSGDGIQIFDSEKNIFLTPDCKFDAFRYAVFDRFGHLWVLQKDWLVCFEISDKKERRNSKK